jgi:hypothetical protein
MRAWVDIFNGPHVHFFQHVGEQADGVIFTARRYRPIPQLLKLYAINARIIGRHGGRDLYNKLIVSSQRVMELAAYIRRQRVDIAIHKHSVEAARVAWGLGIPSISFIDNELMVPQNMLVCPLSNVLIAPIAIDQNVLRDFTPAHVGILQFDGVSEVANVYKHSADERVLRKLNLTSDRPIVVFRGEPVLAAYAAGNGLEDEIVRSIRKRVPDAQIVRIGRQGDDTGEKLPVFDARSLCAFADLVISGGGTMAREAALLSTNAVSYFDRPLAVDRYLVRKGILRTYPGKEILAVDWRRELRRPQRKRILDDLEHPFELLPKAYRLMQARYPSGLSGNNGSNPVPAFH